MIVKHGMNSFKLYVQIFIGLEWLTSCWRRDLQRNGTSGKWLIAIEKNCTKIAIISLLLLTYYVILTND